MKLGMKPLKFFKQTTIEKDWPDLIKRPAAYWEKKGQDMALRLFEFTVKNVPAYKTFLKENNLKPSAVKNYADFLKLVPPVSKENYLKKYKYLDLFPKGVMTDTQTFSSTSGSSGEPFYLPRADEQDWQYEYIAEAILKNHFEINKKSTLAIIGFGLGIWIGGLFTYKVFDRISSKGYNLSIVPVGPNKEGILKALKQFGDKYDQVILCGYPPFLKDLVDEAEKLDVSWKDYNIKLYTAAEGMPEEFQNYIVKKLGIKNSITDLSNIYGTVELGTMAYETPLSNLIKKLICEDKSLLPKIFKVPIKVPTLGQYHPHHIHFETSQNNEIIVSGFGSSIPLMKYKFPDIGEVIPFDVMVERFKNAGIDLLGLAKKNKINHLVQHIPFVAVYGRSDMSVSYIGVILYPDYVRPAFFDPKVEDYVTSKFTMEVFYDSEKNQKLIIHVELREGVSATDLLEQNMEQAVVKALIKSSTEYNHLYSGSDEYKQKILPVIKLHQNKDINYFGPGTKQKWVKK